MKTNIVAARPSFVSIVLLVFSLIAAPPTAFAQSAVSNVGNWVGEYKGQEIELAVWFDSDPMHRGYVRGYILNRDEQCAIGLFGFRTMSVVTTFFSIINDNSLSNYGFDFEIRRIEAEGVNTACNPLQSLPNSSRLMFVFEPELGHASLAAMGDPMQDENRYTNVVRVMSLERATVSPIMTNIIAANPTIDRERGQQIAPTAAVQQLFSDPTLDPLTTIPIDQIPCRALIRDQQVRSYRLGIRDIASSREPNGKLGVRYTQYAGPVPSGVWPEAYRSSGEDRYAQVDASEVSAPALLNLPSTPDGLKFRQEGCEQASVIDDFLAVVEAGGVVTPDTQFAAAVALPRIDDANDLYLFDAAGIDKIRHLSMTRVYGTTTLFAPGDLSREGEWRPSSQSMKMRAMVKHSNSGFIEKDLLSPYVEVSFFFDPELSREVGNDVWVSVEDDRKGGVCIRWRDRHFVDNCAERSTLSMHSAHRYYLTASLDAAKTIFHRVSPNAITLTAEQMADPTRSCERGEFCKHPGGIYLNAIYDGDFDRIQHLDEQVRNASLNAFDTVMPGSKVSPIEQKVYRRTEQAQADAFIKNLMTMAFVPQSSLPYLARRYMYQYQTTSQACFEPGHKPIEKEWIIPPSHTPDTEYNGYFIPGEVIPGSRISATYDVNPEFFALCERVCDAVKPTGRSLYLTDEDRTLSNGIDRVLFDHDCASPTVQQFERNLIKLTEQALAAGARKPFVQRSSL